MSYLQERLDKFYFNVKKYVVTKKDGFYQVPFIANSPQAMVDSFKGIPFNKIDEKKNIVSTDNPFSKGDLHYHKIEDGFWIIYTEMYTKKDLSFKLLYDPALPKNYYCLALPLQHESIISATSILEGETVKYNCWFLTKPGAINDNKHFKGAANKHLMFYFSEQWLAANIDENKFKISKQIKFFLESDRPCLFLPTLFNRSLEKSTQLIDIIKNKGEDGIKNVLDFKIKSLTLIDSFLTEVTSKKSLNANKEGLILNIKNILSDYVYQAFPGIDYLAREFDLSSTKLKTDFKNATGQTIFQFFKQQQMELSRKMLLSDTILIKNLANSFGYENSSKFSAAYKKHFGYLPSETQRN